MLKDKRIISIIILLILLIIIIINIINNNILNIDLKIYNFIAKYINNYNTNIFKIIRFLGSTLFMIIITILFFIILKGREGKIVVITMLGSTLINNIIKLIIARPRPNINPLVVENSYSFPSGHTMAITTLIGILYILKIKPWMKKGRKGRYIAYGIWLIPLLVMLSRIYLGVHYFSDCLGGFIISIIIILITSLLLEKIKL